MIKKIILFLFLATLIYSQVFRGAVVRKSTLGVSTVADTGVTDSIGAEWWAEAGKPIGGGPGMSDTVKTPSNNHSSSWVVTGAGDPEDSLVAFLAAAGNNDTVYILDTVSISLNSLSSATILTIKSGVLLASGRGRWLTDGDSASWGALIYRDNVGIGRSDEYFRALEKSKIKGLRFRGSYSYWDVERDTTDYFNDGSPVSEYCLRILQDSVEVSNCEFWGWGKRAVQTYIGGGYIGVGINIHNNTFHYSTYVYWGYGPDIVYRGKVDFTANYINYNGRFYVSGAPNTPNSDSSWVNSSYNIFGPNRNGAWFTTRDTSGSQDDGKTNCASSHHWNNTYQVSSSCNPPVAVEWWGYIDPLARTDSAFINNCWSYWDSANSWKYDQQPGGGAKIRIYDNHYGTSMPPGLSARIPTAVIAASNDSGSSPLSITFKATGSSDPDGSLKQFHWLAGDSGGSANVDKYTSIADSFVHTYNNIGKYKAELMVVDNNGCRDTKWETINIAPTDGKKYLTCWILDGWHATYPGIFKKQIYLETSGHSWKCWEKDLANDGSWEHVIIDANDSITAWSAEDSLTIKFRLYCNKDTSSFPGAYRKPWVFVDDVWLYGGDIKNGDLDSSVTWSGAQYARTDGNWIGASNPANTKYDSKEWRLETHSGYGCFKLMIEETGSVTAGYYCSVYQKIAMPQ